MNKTLSISLAGFSFMVEEHAYTKISDYLKALRSTLDATEADEVMHDIEIRMVEIFREILGKREVINDDDAEKMIDKIGRPEIIEEQEEAYFSEKNPVKISGKVSAEKTLLRDPVNKKIAGVCAGIAQYFGMDITIMRLIWVALVLIPLFTHSKFFLLVILAYVVFWVVLPLAKSASDFLKMKGEPLSFDNLKQESNKLYQFTTDSTQKVGEIYNKNLPKIQDSGEDLWNVIRYILGAFLGLIGIAFLIGSAAILGTSWVDFSHLPFPGQINFVDDNLRRAAIYLAFLATFIFALIFIFLSVKLIWPKRKMRNTLYLLGGLFLIWLGLLGYITAMGVNYKNKYRGEKSDTSTVAITSPSDSILVDLKKVEIPRNFVNLGDDYFTDKKTIFEEDYPDLDVTRKDGNFAPYLLVKKYADGYNIPINLQVPVEVTGNKILLPNYIAYPYADRLRDSRVEYELVIPKSKKVVAVNGENGFDINDDEDENESDTDSTAVNSAKNTIIIGAKNGDSVLVNGKKIDKKDAGKIIEKTMENGLQNVKIKNGKNEIVIQTK